MHQYLQNLFTSFELRNIVSLFFLVSFDGCWGQVLSFSFLGSSSGSADLPGNFLSCVHVVVVGDPASLGLHALVEHVSLPVVIAEVQGFAIFS